jgi:hypothetical protein
VIEATTASEPERFPLTATYLRELPDGLDSFPECRAKASIHRTVYAHADAPLHGLPAELQQLLDEPPPPATWIPQCHTLALIIAIVESRGLDEGERGAWIRAAASTLFATPMYRILMLAATPRMLFKGANIRWSAFFRGSELRSTMGDHVAELELLAPAQLFNPALADIFTDVLRAAVNFTEDRSSGAQVDFDRFEPGCVHYRGRW